VSNASPPSFGNPLTGIKRQSRQRAEFFAIVRLRRVLPVVSRFSPTPRRAATWSATGRIPRWPRPRAQRFGSRSQRWWRRSRCRCAACCTRWGTHGSPIAWSPRHCARPRHGRSMGRRLPRPRRTRNSARARAVPQPPLPPRRRHPTRRSRKHPRGRWPRANPPRSSRHGVHCRHRHVHRRRPEPQAQRTTRHPRSPTAGFARTAKSITPAASRTRITRPAPKRSARRARHRPRNRR
jgi:hypothetical protein